MENLCMKCGNQFNGVCECDKARRDAIKEAQEFSAVLSALSGKPPLPEVVLEDVMNISDRFKEFYSKWGYRKTVSLVNSCSHWLTHTEMARGGKH